MHLVAYSSTQIIEWVKISFILSHVLILWYWELKLADYYCDLDYLWTDNSRNPKIWTIQGSMTDGGLSAETLTFFFLVELANYLPSSSRQKSAILMKKKILFRHDESIRKCWHTARYRRTQRVLHIMISNILLKYIVNIKHFVNLIDVDAGGRWTIVY